jgi:hypothetical protein
MTMLMLLLTRSYKMVAFREAIELSIAVLITGIVVGFIAYAGAPDRFAVKLSSPSQTCPLSLEPDYAVGCSRNTTALLRMQLQGPQPPFRLADGEE